MATSFESRSWHLLAGAELALVVEVRLVDDALEVVGLGELTDGYVDLLADLLVAFQLHHVGRNRRPVAPR